MLTINEPTETLDDDRRANVLRSKKLRVQSLRHWLHLQTYSFESEINMRKDHFTRNFLEEK